MGELNFCLLQDIFKEVSTQINTNIPLDSGLPIWLIRFIHNKVYSFIFNFLRCYFFYFDLDQIGRYVPFVFIPLAMYALLFLKLRKLKLWVLVLFPLLNIWDPLHLNLGIRILIFQIFYIAAGLYGMYLSYKKLRAILNHYP